MGPAAVHLREHSEERLSRLPACHEALWPAVPRKRGILFCCTQNICCFFIFLINGGSISTVSVYFIFYLFYFMLFCLALIKIGLLSPVAVLVVDYWVGGGQLNQVYLCFLFHFSAFQFLTLTSPSPLIPLPWHAFGSTWTAKLRMTTLNYKYPYRTLWNYTTSTYLKYVFTSLNSIKQKFCNWLVMEKTQANLITPAFLHLVSQVSPAVVAQQDPGHVWL